MTTRPALITTTSIHHAAKIMTARHFRHLPVAVARVKSRGVRSPGRGC